jgi:putative transcriptional regulator
LAQASTDAVARIAGSVVASSDPGQAMKAWREKLGLKQIALAKEMKISPSVLSDYESGRRPSPGVQFVRKYVEALVSLDESKERVMSKLVSGEKDAAILSIGEFQTPVTAAAIIKAVNGRVLSGEDTSARIYGYTVVDSIKTIYALSGYDFYRIFGATTERALIFTRVGMGRSPLVAIRVSQLKPRMVIIHGPKELDPLAVDLARREGIVLALSSSPTVEDLISSLKALAGQIPPPESSEFKAFPKEDIKIFHIDGLCEKIIRALAHGINRYRDIAMPGNDNQWYIRIARPEARYPFQTASVGQMEIKQNGVESLGQDRILGFGQAVCSLNDIARF